MNYLKLCCSFLAFTCMTLTGFSQPYFTECTAAFVNNEAVVDDYSPRGTCQIDSTATGTLTVQTAEISKGQCNPHRKVPFSIAIRDGQTKTLWPYKKETVLDIELKDLLAYCKSGDSIVLLMHDKEYALPHNEIFIR